MNYTVIYSSRRSLALQVGRDKEVVVRAPYFVSKEEIERFVSEKRNWIEEAQKKQSEKIAYPEDYAKKAELYRKAVDLLPQKVSYYGKILGLFPREIRVGFAKSQFGSCSKEKKISFSAYLMLYPEKAIDYVVVHELCHLKYMNHQKEFYALVKSVLPDYRERLRLLKR